MPDAVQAIKNIVKGYVDNENLSDVCYGTYTGNGLKIDNKPVIIPRAMVDVPERLKEYNIKLTINLDEQQCDELVKVILKDDSVLPIKSIQLTDVPCKVAYDELKPGDRVVVMQKKGSQKFVIMDKVKK